jgi:hypothetical protein
MIKESLEKLLVITKIPAADATLIKEELKKMFTENENNILDEITQKTNREAQTIIESLFK